MNRVHVSKGYVLCVPTLAGEVMLLSIPHAATSIDLDFFRRNAEDFLNGFLDEIIVEKILSEEALRDAQ